MEYLIIFLAVAAFGMRHRWETGKDDRAARVKHRAQQIGKAAPGLDPVQREKAAKRSMRGDAMYQVLHGLPRFRGDVGAGWREAKDAHHEWVKRTGKKPGMRNAVKAAREATKAHRERVRNGQPCRACGTKQRVAWRNDVTEPGWLCRDHWKAAPKVSADEARRRRQPPKPDGKPGDDRRHKKPRPDDDPPSGGDPGGGWGTAWARRNRGRTSAADEPVPPKVRVSVGDPMSDPTYSPQSGDAVPPRAVDRGQPAITAPPTGTPGPSKGDSTVSDLMPTGGGLPAVTGEVVGIDTARQQLGAFEQHADKFRVLAERIQAAAAQARQEVMRMQAAADAMSASMAQAEVDPQTLAEAAEIFEWLERLNSSVQGLEHAALNVHESADGVASAASRTRSGMNARHSGVEEAVKGAPVPRTARREFYED